jgi:putative hydrolase of the HAD superfamily
MSTEKDRIPGSLIEVIGFDGDDTLWHNERLFTLTQERIRELLSRYVEPERIGERLLATEIRNLGVFGYGVKGFTLSMIETAIEVTGGRVRAREIQEIIDAGRAMLAQPVELLDGVLEVLGSLSGRYRLLLVTKGDLFDQESKIARSGLADRFWRIEVVSEKDDAAYARILARHDIRPDQFVMVGNSLRSDVLPVVAIGAHAVHVPYDTTWAHEQVEVDETQRNGFWRLDRLADLPSLLAQKSAGVARE